MIARLESIAWKFIIVLVPTLTISAILFLSVFMYVKYRDLQDELEAKVELLARVHALAVSEPLWTLNTESLERNVGTISIHPEILCVEVWDSSELLISSWPEDDCEAFEARSKQRVVGLEFNGELVGRLELHYTDSSIVDALVKEIELAALLFFLLMIVACGAALVAHRLIIGVPLGHLLQSIQTAERENRRLPVAWSSRDELGRVITAYNGMIQQVDQRTRELETAREQAVEANRTKSNFLANMSHELRTPLNAIIGFSRVVMRRSKDTLEPREFENMGKILGSAEHLLSLINTVLDLSKIEAGRMELYPEEFDLEPAIEACLRTVEPMVQSKDLALVVDIEAGLPTLVTDEDKLKQILINLLSNAVKFTAAGRVSVTCRRAPGAVSIAVADTGIGIAPDALGSIFEEFRQVDGSSTRQYGGTGLGLAITRHLVELLGARIEVESEQGEGSTFTVTVPIRYVFAPNSAPPSATPPEPPETEREPLAGQG